MIVFGFVGKFCNRVKDTQNKLQKTKTYTNYMEGVKDTRLTGKYLSFDIHNSKHFRVFRWIGKYSLLISVYISAVGISTVQNYLYTPIIYLIWGISILFSTYMFVYSVAGLFKTMHFIVTGKWLKKNSPIQWKQSGTKLLGGFREGALYALGVGGVTGGGLVTINTIAEWTENPAILEHRPAAYVKSITDKLFSEQVPSSSSTMEAINESLKRENMTLADKLKKYEQESELQAQLRKIDSNKKLV